MCEQGADLRIVTRLPYCPRWTHVGILLESESWSRRPTSDQDFDIDEDLGLDWDIFKF